MERAQELALNLDETKKKIEEACRKAGRNPEVVQLLAVSKTKPVEDVQLAAAHGQQAFGENYVQEIREKYEAIGDSVEWHMIGHLQRNKVKYIIDKVKMIHSVDSIRLAEQIEKEAEKKNLTMDILMEVNVAKEESKWGFTVEEAVDAAKHISSELPHVHLRGLMTSAPIVEDPEEDRIYFRQLRELSEQIDSLHLPNVKMDTLSMGMSQDYQVAIEEGSTMVRVGTNIFGKRNYATGPETK